MIFANRLAAARLLAEALAGSRGKNPLVLAIPRGALPMAKVIAEELNGEMDVVLVRKLRTPGNPEYAIGSVDESGWAYIASQAANVGANEGYLKREIAAQLEAMQRWRAQYTPVRPPIDPAGRIVIVIDDGLATGSTMIAALHALRAKKPAQLICAIPVAPPDTLERIRASADKVVCLSAPVEFYAVGQFYQDFQQVEDEEVVATLAASGHASSQS